MAISRESGRRLEFERDSIRKCMIIEGSLEAKLPTIWTGTARKKLRHGPGMVKVRQEKIRDGEDQKGRKSEERRSRCDKR